jgi:hypothetical protein
MWTIMTVFFWNKLSLVGWCFHTFGKSLVSENRYRDSGLFLRTGQIRLSALIGLG